MTCWVACSKGSVWGSDRARRGGTCFIVMHLPKLNDGRLIDPQPQLTAFGAHVRLTRVLAVTALALTAACGSDLSGLKSEDEYPYKVTLIFDLATDTSPACLQQATPCPVRLKGNVTSRWLVRVPGAQIYGRVSGATTFTPLVKADQSGIFNITIPLEKTATGRGITLCAGETLDVAVTGQCPTLNLP
jgi:hypothetical protein